MAIEASHFSSGELDTQAVMYSLVSNGGEVTGLDADSVNTVSYARTGLDSIAGNGDDYSVSLVLTDDCTNADVEVVMTDTITANAPGACTAGLDAIDTPGIDIHFELVQGGALPRPRVSINSTTRWNVLFVDGFESGDLGGWSAAVLP